MRVILSMVMMTRALLPHQDRSVWRGPCTGILASAEEWSLAEAALPPGRFWACEEAWGVGSLQIAYCALHIAHGNRAPSLSYGSAPKYGMIITIMVNKIYMMHFLNLDGPFKVFDNGPRGRVRMLLWWLWWDDDDVCGQTYNWSVKRKTWFTAGVTPYLANQTDACCQGCWTVPDKSR